MYDDNPYLLNSFKQIKGLSQNKNVIFFNTFALISLVRMSLLTDHLVIKYSQLLCV